MSAQSLERRHWNVFGFSVVMAVNYCGDLLRERERESAYREQNLFSAPLFVAIRVGSNKFCKDAEDI